MLHRIPKFYHLDHFLTLWISVYSTMPASGSERELVSLIFFFASKRNEANRDPFHMRFACSLQIFRVPFFAIFAYFRIKFFALCRFINFWLNINCWMWVPVPIYRYIYNLFNVYASHLHGQCVEAGCELICSVRPGQWDTPYMFTIAHVRYRDLFL